MKHVPSPIPGKLEVTQNIACALNSNFTLGIYKDLRVIFTRNNFILFVDQTRLFLEVVIFLEIWRRALEIWIFLICGMGNRVWKASTLAPLGAPCQCLYWQSPLFRVFNLGLVHIYHTARDNGIIRALISGFTPSTRWIRVNPGPLMAKKGWETRIICKYQTVSESDVDWTPTRGYLEPLGKYNASGFSWQVILFKSRFLKLNI